MMEKQFNFNDFDVRDALVEYVKNHFDCDVSPDHSTVVVTPYSGSALASTTSYKASIKATDLRKRKPKKELSDKKSGKRGNDSDEDFIGLDDDVDLSYEPGHNEPY